jgi:hypothetical protein
VKYDDASWHFGGSFPEGSPDEFGGTHIALFIKWCFVRGWAGELHLEEWPDDVAKVVSGQMTATEFLFKNCDGKFTDEDLSEDGNRFAAVYYGENGPYLDDYTNGFGDLMYLRPEVDHDFSKFTEMVDRRLSRSGLVQSTKAKPWWKVF